jgi:hypothetical protein
MKDIIFYRDDNDIFECSVKVNGSSLNNTKARMIFEFSDRSYVFNGKVNKDGVVTVDIPKLSEIKENKGNATLEVIVDSLLFTPWKSDFELEDKNNVVVESVSINRRNDVSLVVESVNTNHKPIIKENCTEKNRGIISNILDESDDSHDLGWYHPKGKILEWTKNNFVNPESYEAKYCGYILERRINKKR